MSVFDLQPGHGPGTWQRTIVDEFGDAPRWSAVLWCPACRMPLSIPNHTIGASGLVSPSVGHPDHPRYAGCGWHPSAVRLVGWTDGAPPPVREKNRCVQCGVESRCLGGWELGALGLRCPSCWRPDQKETPIP